MTYIVWMTLPISFHLRKKVGSIEALRLGDGVLNQFRLLTAHLAVVRSIKVIESCCNALDCFVLRGVRLRQRGNCFSLKVR